MIAARNRTFAWSLAASTVLHAGVLLGALPGLWSPWVAGGNTVLEARLSPQNNGPAAGAAPEPVRERLPEPVITPPVEEPAPPPPEPVAAEPPPPPLLAPPDAEPVIQKEEFPIAKAREALPEPAREAPPPAEPLPAPRAVLQAGAPEYPPEALAERIVGCVLAEIYVDDLGRVERVEIAASTQPGIFDESVRKAYGENFYVPAENAGRRVRTRILGVASFELEGFAPLLCEQHFVDLAREINARPYP